MEHQWAQPSLKPIVTVDPSKLPPPMPIGRPRAMSVETVARAVRPLPAIPVQEIVAKTVNYRDLIGQVFDISKPAQNYSIADHGLPKDFEVVAVMRTNGTYTYAYVMPTPEGNQVINVGSGYKPLYVTKMKILPGRPVMDIN